MTTHVTAAVVPCSQTRTPEESMDSLASSVKESNDSAAQLQESGCVGAVARTAVGPAGAQRNAARTCVVVVVQPSLTLKSTRRTPGFVAKTDAVLPDDEMASAPAYVVSEPIAAAASPPFASYDAGVLSRRVHE